MPTETAPPAIELRQVNKHFDALKAVDDLSLRVEAGEFFGLLGPNGSGKTTTVHLCTTLLQPTSGDIRVVGHDALRAPVAVRRELGLVFQESSLDRTLSVWENLRFAAALYDIPGPLARRRCRELLALFRLEDKASTQVLKLSGGMRRAVDIARGVLHHPRVLFLDEPTVGLDVVNRDLIWQFLETLRREQGMTVIASTHYLEEALPCDRIAFMRQGRLTALGSPDEMLRGIGNYVLEIHTENDAAPGLPDALLGAPLRLGDRLLYRVAAHDPPMDELRRRLGDRVRSLQLRRPSLNDVYLWQTHGTS